MITTMRSCHCGAVNTQMVGEVAAVSGWVDAVRPHGGLVFVNLRDRTGIVQLVVQESDVDCFSLAQHLHLEYVIRAVGLVRARPTGLVNQDMATGEVEIAVQSLELLAKSEPLPFNLSDGERVSDELALRYRYLALRRPELISKLQFRSRLVQSIREFYHARGFIEVETPYLTKPTPEGARDFLVPSRNSPGSFYALPQSPQIFKQLLMAAGVDRYFQVVKCFRDEDLRADRQPEFTQLDVELSFVNEEDIMQLHEELLIKLFQDFLQVELPTPFPRISYRQAMLDYGSDKPDLRCDLPLMDLAEFLTGLKCPFWQGLDPVRGDRIIGIKLSGQASNCSRKHLDGYAGLVKKYGMTLPLVYIKFQSATANGLEGVSSSIARYLTLEVFQRLKQHCQLTEGDVLLVGAGRFETSSTAMGALRLELAKDYGLLRDKEWRPLWVTDFPMFVEEEGKITFMHHPFTMPRVPSVEALLNDPLVWSSRAYDLALNGIELGGGSIRIHQEEMQLAVFKILGMDEETVRAQFGHLLEAFKYGYPPEGGIAWGLDRLVMLMSKSASLREVIAFPKTQTGACPLTGAPARSDVAQLAELGLTLIGE